MAQQPPEETGNIPATAQDESHAGKAATADKAKKEPGSSNKPVKENPVEQNQVQQNQAQQKQTQQNQTQPIHSQQAQSKAAKPEKFVTGNAKSSKKGKKGKVFVKLLVLICLAVIAVGGYWAYQNRGLFEKGFIFNADLPSNNAKETSTEVKQGLAEQRALISDLQRGLEREREQRITTESNNENLLVAMSTELASQRSRITELGATSRSDWLLAEAAFLLRMGNQRLIIERDPINTLQLLNTADRILRDIDELDLLPVRKALAADITKLGLIEQIDRDGIYFRLDAVATEIATLPMMPMVEKLPSEPLLEQNVAENIWKQLWLNLKHTASDLIDKAFDFRPNDYSIKPLLTAEQQQAVRITVALQLEQAQVALLREQSEIYRASLDKVIKLLSENFSLNEGASETIVQLTQLQEQEIDQNLPDVSSSLNLLQAVIKARHARPESEKSGDQ